MSTGKKFTRILLPQVAVFEEVSSSHIRATGRLLPFLLEEFISRGAIEIIIEDPWRYKAELTQLPLAMRGHIKVSHSSKKSWDISRKLFEPFFDEYELKAESGGVSHMRTPREEDKKIIDAGVQTFFDLPAFLSALRLRAQLDFDLRAVKRNIALLRDRSRSPEMRANSSALLGIFSAYETVTHDALVLHANAPEEVAQRFLDFAEDLYFQRLSEELHILGFLEPAIANIPKINRAVRAIFKRPVAKKIADLGSRAVTVATGVPVPDTSLAEALLVSRYLPPVINLRTALAKAKRNFVKHGNIEGIVGLDPKRASERSPD
jgi:hypothetical protein